MPSAMILSSQILKTSKQGEPTISLVTCSSVALISGEHIFPLVQSELLKLQLYVMIHLLPLPRKVMFQYPCNCLSSICTQLFNHSNHLLVRLNKPSSPCHSLWLICSILCPVWQSSIGPSPVSPHSSGTAGQQTRHSPSAASEMPWRMRTVTYLNLLAMLLQHSFIAAYRVRPGRTYFQENQYISISYINMLQAED